MISLASYEHGWASASSLWRVFFQRLLQLGKAGVGARWQDSPPGLPCPAEEPVSRCMRPRGASSRRPMSGTGRRDVLRVGTHVPSLRRPAPLWRTRANEVHRRGRFPVRVCDAHLLNGVSAARPNDPSW